MSEQTKAAVDYESFASSLEPLEQKLLDSFLNGETLIICHLSSYLA